ncbi:MAG TPA: MerR family transcriptional regulator, partial [Bryobacteraceae bacterium]
AGVEIILNMRERMSEMHAQIQEFVASLNSELASRNTRPDSDDRHGLIPVVNARVPMRRNSR